MWMRKLVINLKPEEQAGLSPLKPICDGMNHPWTYFAYRLTCRDCGVGMTAALNEEAVRV